MGLFSDRGVLLTTMDLLNDHGVLLKNRHESRKIGHGYVITTDMTCNHNSGPKYVINCGLSVWGLSPSSDIIMSPDVLLLPLERSKGFNPTLRKKYLMKADS